MENNFPHCYVVFDLDTRQVYDIFFDKSPETAGVEAAHRLTKQLLADNIGRPTFERIVQSSEEFIMTTYNTLSKMLETGLFEAS